MFEIARFEMERQRTAALTISIGLAVYAMLFLAIGPEMVAEIDMSQYVQALPEGFTRAFGLEAMTGFAGLMAAELYQFGWVILLGLYSAYAAGRLVSREVERGRMDLLLSNPVSRTRLLIEKYLSLFQTFLMVNLVVGVTVYFGSMIVDESLAFSNVAMVHLLSIPYFLATASIGLLFSTLFSREDLSRRSAIGVVFGLFMVETLVAGTDYAFLGKLSPTWYYDPTEILVHGSYDLAGAGILLGVAMVLVAASVLYFREKDLE
ncbi:MAG: ABC transporter permease [Candidatus Nanohaloarchaea archaeon]